MASQLLFAVRRRLSRVAPAPRAQVRKLELSISALAADADVLMQEFTARSLDIVERIDRTHSEAFVGARTRHDHAWAAAHERHVTVLQRVAVLDDCLVAVQESIKSLGIMLGTSLDRKESMAEEHHRTTLDYINKADDDASLAAQTRHETVLGRLNAVDEFLLTRLDGIEQRMANNNRDAWTAADLRHQSTTATLNDVTAALATTVQRVGRIERTLREGGGQPRLSYSTSVKAQAPIDVFDANDLRPPKLTPDRTGTWLVSASNDNFLPLAQGLWKSIAAADLDSEFTLAWIDIGGAERTREWLTAEMPNVEQVEISESVREFIERLSSQNYHSALLIRPFLPDMLNDAQNIIWIDSDIWLQDGSSIRAFDEALHLEPRNAAIVPIMDIAYPAMLDQAKSFTDDNIRRVWRELYGDKVADDFTPRPLLSAGIFGMNRHSPVWGEWATEIERLWKRKAEIAPEVLHVAEQTALTYLLYSSGRLTALDSVHNFHANLGELRRNSDGVVTTIAPNHRRIGAIHLSDIVTRDLAQKYLAKELLYEGGSYLTDADVAHIISLTRD